VFIFVQLNRGEHRWREIHGDLLTPTSPGSFAMTNHTALILLSAVFTALVAILIALAAGFLALRDRNTWPRAVVRAAAAFAATLTLAAVLAMAAHTLGL
jgi:ABC-type dipeptide/oligopeptide/nickel transport system permease component